MTTAYHAKYFAHELTKRCPSDSVQKFAASLANAMSQSGLENVVHMGQPKDAVARWRALSKPGDVILTLGAGDLPHVYKDLF